MLVHELNTDATPETTADIECKIAVTRKEREAAFRLVYNSYLRAGLGQPNPHKMRVTPYHLLPTTEVFIATCDGEAVFTVSLVVDGELGLPMESVYGREVAARREQGLLVGEVTCLADRRRQFKRFFPVFLKLSRLMAQYAWNRGLHELLAAVHPKHARFYRRFMHFETIGEERSYPTVRNHPAVALSLNFARVDRERPDSFETFFGQWLPEEHLEPQPIRMEQREFFSPMVDPSFNLAPLGDFDDHHEDDTAELALNVA